MNQRAFRAVAGAIACGGLLASTVASAIVPTCVQNAAELQAALTAAATDNQFNYIAVATGTYNFAAPLVVNVTDGYALTIEGGYAPGCAGLPTPVPDNTIINGANGTNLRIVTQRGNLTLRNLTLSGFKPAAGTNAIFVGTAYGSDTLRMENLSVSGNGVNGINDSILAVYPAGALEFHDNVVHDNANALAAVRVVAFYADLPIYIANNTVTANAGPGMSISVYSLLPTVLSNNIFWNNGTSDLVVDANVGNDPPAAFNNTWLNCGGCSNLSLASDNNSTADPKLTTSAPKFRLGASSPAINSGIPVPLTLGALDAAGNARVVGSAPDRGAYETASNDLPAQTYLVTSNSDDAANIFSLRHAITSANAVGLPAAIHFHFSSCPQVIDLATPLPPITVPMIIDGYTDPGSVVNTAQPGPVDDIPFNATICPILFGNATPAPASALSVSDTAASTVHLEVRGLRMENFQTAIHLSGGNGHWIHGNAFVGPFVFPGTFIGNGIGVQIDGGFADVIGGHATADVDLIGASSGNAAVLISGGSGSVQNWYHTVIRNSVGGDPTGTSNATFKNANNGIVIQNARQQNVFDNWVVANGGDGIVLDGSTTTLVQMNRIGSNINAGLGNAGMGVRIKGGASSNWVGTTQPGLIGRGNSINDNGGAGVLVDLDAGTYNEVTNNAILSNGGLAIDLALLGATANVGTENSGPNRLLHKPLMSSAVYTAVPGTIKVSGTLTTTSANEYRYLSFYASGRCGGDATSPLGTYALQSDANGVLAFALSIPQPDYGPAWITATDDDYTAGVNNTSEISNSRHLAVVDDLFYDNFDCY